MAKMKIYEFARSLQERYPDIKGKDLVKLLQENNFDVKAPQSSIEDAAIAFLLKHFNGKPEPKKEEEPAYTVPVKRESNVKKNQEKKKAQEAAKPDPDADYVDDDEDYGYDPELRYRDSYPRIRKKVVRCKTDSFLTCQTWNLCQA